MPYLTGILASYTEMNHFYYFSAWNCERIYMTSEIRTDFKEYIDRVLPYFNDYNIPALKCEILGYHIDNLKSTILELEEQSKGYSVYSNNKSYSVKGSHPPLIELTPKQKNLVIDIDIKVRHELENYPRLRKFWHFLSSYVVEIGNTLTSTIGTSSRVFSNITVSDYLDDVTRLRRRTFVSGSKRASKN